MLAVAALVLLGILGIVAETGLIQIPVLSSVLYATPPQPIRAVEPAGPADVGSLLKSKAGATEGQVQVAVTEGELTQLVREPQTDGQVPVKQAQVAIEPRFIELYGLMNINQGASTTVIRVRLTPGTTPGEFQLSEIYIGYVRVPIALAKGIVALLTHITPPDMLSAAKYGVQSIALQQGVATVSLDAATLQGALTDQAGNR